MTKVLVSLDDRLLARIDRAAKARGLTRSAYLSQLAESASQADARRRLSAAERALGELDRLFAGAPAQESTAAIRELRDAR